MKTFAILWKSMFVIMVCIMILFIGCSKEDENNPVNNSGQRIIGAKLILLDTLELNETFIYDGNLLSEIIMGETMISDSDKYVLQYAGGKVSAGTYYSKHNGNWIKENSDEIMGYTGNNPSGIHNVSYDSTGMVEYESKTLYTYSGTLLTKADYYSKYTGNWVLFSSMTYMYDSQGRINQITDTSTNWGYLSGYITTYRYEGDHMAESIVLYYSYDGHDTLEKCIYQYANDRLTGKTYYNREAGIWTVSGEWQYQYNEAGNLIREWQTDGRWDYTYTYGQGTGNYAECMKTFSIQSILPGDPSPYPVKPVKTTPGSGSFNSNSPGSFHR